MEKKMTFNYFYGTEADQFSFYRIPKALFTDSYFKDLSSDAKILYGLMLDRMSLSIKNQWFDEQNRAYIYFSIEDIMELLNCGRNKAIKSSVKTSIKKVVAAVESGDKAVAVSSLTDAISTIDKATSKGIYHKNTAARKVSRLSKAVNKMA